MKRAPAPTKTQGALDQAVDSINSGTHDAGVQAALKAVSGWGNFEPELGAKLILDLAAIDSSGAIVEPRAVLALSKLAALVGRQAEKKWEHDWKFLSEASDLLSNSIVEGLANGFGDFDARLRPNGTIVFIGELSSIYASMLRVDQETILERVWPRVPHVFFIERKSGEVLPVMGLQHAAELLSKTKREELEIFEVNAWYARAMRRGEA
jgi:hypothetical protein